MDAGPFLDKPGGAITDIIYLKNHRYDAIVGLDCWGRKKAQQVVTSIRITSDVTAAGETDDIGQTLNYGQVAKELAKVTEDGREYSNFATLNRQLATTILRLKQAQVHVKSIAPKGLLRGGFGCESWHGSDHQLIVTVFDALRLWVIVGVNEHERLAKQLVVVNLQVQEDGAAASDPERVSAAVEDVMNKTESTEFKLLESMAKCIADGLLMAATVHKITVSVEKPNALAFVDSAGVEITRSKKKSGPPDMRQLMI